MHTRVRDQPRPQQDALETAQEVLDRQRGRESPAPSRSIARWRLKTKDPSIGAVTTEAMLRVLLSVQHHREGLKTPLSEARQGASSGSEQVFKMISTFADNMISTSPLASVPTPLRELAINMYKSLIAKLDAVAEDTSSRSTAWKNFLKLLPAAYALTSAGHGGQT